MQGHWKFQYSLIPHEGGWENAFEQAHNFARPMRAIRTSRGRGELPSEGSFLEIEPATVILSALKVAEDDGSTIVRVYNISNEAVEGRVRPRWAFGKVERVDLNEESPVRVKAERGVVRLALKANEIVTLRFSVRRPRPFISVKREVTTRGLREPNDPAETAAVPARPRRPAGGAGAAANP
jgi:alpha-mannosidase